MIPPYSVTRHHTLDDPTGLEQDAGREDEYELDEEEEDEF